MLRSRASRLFTASMLVIGVMVLVNLVALIEVRAAGNGCTRTRRRGCSRPSACSSKRPT
jgi:hypothetical protein